MKTACVSLLLLGFACAKPTTNDPGAALVPVSTSQPVSQPMKTPNIPVMVGNTFVDPITGKPLMSLAVDLQYEFARPAEVLHQYTIGAQLMDATTQTVVTTYKNVFAIEKDERIVRKDGPNWEYSPGGRVGSLRAPDLVWTESQVFAAVSDGVIALDANDGKLLWRAKGPEDHLALFRGLVVGVDCTSSSALTKRWMAAYEQKTGAEAFRVEIPVEEEPETPVVIGDFLLVRGDKYSILLDAKGKEIFRRADRIAEMKASQPNGWVISTNKTIARLDSSGKELWSLKGFQDTFVHESHLLPLDGDLLLYNFGAISDSGVELVRLDANGKELWRSNVLGAMVSHSEYYHVAYVQPRNGELIVVSQGSYAKFIEVLDAKTGKSLRRFSHL